MTSLQEAFGDTAEGEERLQANDMPGHYADPKHPRYKDVGLDEAERRYDYEQSRQMLYAKSPPQSNRAHPVMTSQESFQQMLPGGQQMDLVREAALSCKNCRGNMSCAADDVFCRTCNHDCLKQKSPECEGKIPNLWQ